MKQLAILVILASFVGIALAADRTPATIVQKTIAVTSNDAIAVGGSTAVILTSAAVSTNCTIANPQTATASLVIINTSTNAVTITDGANIEGAGAMVMGQYDSLSLKAISASKWVEVGRSNN